MSEVSLQGQDFRSAFTLYSGIASELPRPWNFAMVKLILTNETGRKELHSRAGIPVS
jgi:hypothetical protein